MGYYIRKPINSDIPCYKFPDRHENCHSTCEKYIAYRKGREALYEKLDRNRDIYEYQADKKTKIARYNKNHL